MRLEIPLQQQEQPWTCLAACLKMCLDFLDVELPEAAIAAACGTTYAGASLEQAADGLKALDFAGEIHDPVDLDWLFDRLAVGEPVIVFLHAGFAPDRPIRHAVVVSGADGGEITFADPTTGTERALTEAEFCRRWSLAGGGALAVYRP